jgi:succinate dehydrogenase / fumarate reductase flavoprotein subunit
MVKRENDKQSKLLKGDGPENPYKLWQEMGKWMTDNCTVIRHNDRLERTIARCQEWKNRYQRMSLSDTGMWTNQNLSFARAVGDMIILAEAILKAAILRDESRGAHFKPAYPDRLDDQFLKTTIASYDARGDQPVITYEPVDTSLIPPRARTYGKKPDAAPAAKPTAAPPASGTGAPVAAAT